MNQTCDRCGPAVRAAYRVDRQGELYLCRHCASHHWSALSAQGWTIWPAGEHAVAPQANHSRPTDAVRRPDLGKADPSSPWTSTADRATQSPVKEDQSDHGQPRSPHSRHQHLHGHHCAKHPSGIHRPRGSGGTRPLPGSACPQSAPARSRHARAQAGTSRQPMLWPAACHR